MSDHIKDGIYSNILFNNLLSEHILLLLIKAKNFLLSLRNFKHSMLDTQYPVLFFLSFHSRHFLLFFQEFLHSSLYHFLDHFVFIECRMALIASLHFERPRNRRIDSKFRAADTLHFYILVIIPMNSLFH